ncbi:GTP-binding protein [Mesobacillus campisalis]|uniref:GTP-binding protein n=1 Tax=Mesobacillus campisalis TaxID=1408103 RepID=A0A0M2SPP0_9BACI|nr:GTP-binding protein [Mesobacillus campisalis]KKK36524.1 GTP-binding protein [Mesobacillus campisalis]
MTMDEQLIKKAYFEKYIEGSEEHPVLILGELSLEEGRKEIPDLSYLRFAQGEVYFHHKDYETAIFKWENIQNELEGWAKKNMADAYLELGLPGTAEGIYLSIDTESITLKIETGLQLLSIYMEQGKLERATEIVSAAVALKPDYPEITEIARSFYEENKNWERAVKLAMEEGIRTRETQWFDRLNTYVDAGYTDGNLPDYFNEALKALFDIDRKRFEKLAVSLWSQYRNQPEFIAWVKNFNTLFFDLDASRSEGWRDLSAVYQEAYFELINGTRLVRELSPLIPVHLTNWLKITNPASSLFASSSVMAWSEMFPSSIPSETVRDAEDLILNARKYPSAKEDTLELFEMLLVWSDKNGIEAGNRIQWLMEELATDDTQHIVLAGVSGSGKAGLVNQLLDEELLAGQTSAVVAFKPGDEPQIREISDEEISLIANYEEFQEAAGIRRQNYKREKIIDVRIPNEFLETNGLTLVDTPDISPDNMNVNPLYQYVNFADRMLFVLNQENPLTELEQEVLMEISRLAPDLQVHFLVCRHQPFQDEQEAVDILSRIQVFYPNARLFMFSESYAGEAQKRELAKFLREGIGNPGEERILKLQHYTRIAIHYLLDKRIEMENDLVESVRWNEEMVSKLKGAIHQVQDLEEEKKKYIKEDYLKIKEEIRAEMLKEIPNILRRTSDIIKEDSDFGNLHAKLNDEMNDRVQEYLDTKILRSYYSSLQDWISLSKDEFEQAQFKLDEMSQGFNAMFGEERIVQQCDFKVLDDWKRDADRMTSGIQLEKINFLRSPAQFLLKSAGMLLSVLPQNNAMLYNKYKSYVENEDYSESARSIAKRFFKQFEMFEKSIERDIGLFFRQPLHVLEEAVKESGHEIETSQKALEKMRVKPEVYRDPLNLFEVRLRQYEWMTAAGKQGG